MTIVIDPPRALNAWECSMLEALLAEPLPGYEELRLQIPAARVSETYPEGDPTVIFVVDGREVPAAPVTGMALIDRFCLDTDGMVVEVILHVVNGFLWELEIVRGDGGPLLAMLEPSSLKPISDYGA